MLTLLGYHTQTKRLTFTVYAENGDVYVACSTNSGAVCGSTRRKHLRFSLPSCQKVAQASSSRHVHAVRIPLLASSGLTPLAASKAPNAGFATFRNGNLLRSSVASGRLSDRVSRQRLSVSSAAATDVQEETHEYQAEVKGTQLTILCLMLSPDGYLSPYMHQLVEGLHLPCASEQQRSSACMLFWERDSQDTHSLANCTNSRAGAPDDGHDSKQPVQQQGGFPQGACQ